MIPSQGSKPEREASKICSHRIPIDAIQTSLGDQTASEQFLVLIGRNGWSRAVMPRPAIDKSCRNLSASLYQEGAATHCGIAHLKSENFVWRGVLPNSCEGGRKGVRDNRVGQITRRVMAARSPPLVRRLQQRRPTWPDVAMWGTSRVNDR